MPKDAPRIPCVTHDVSQPQFDTRCDERIEMAVLQRFDNLVANVTDKVWSDDRPNPDEEQQEGTMASRNVENYRAGHEAFNRRAFATMTNDYADRIAWTDHARGWTFTTPEEFRDDFLAGWIESSSDIRIASPRYIDAGQTVVCTFTVEGTHDGPLGPFPASGKRFVLPLCEMWHFESSGRVVGGDLYYDQVSMLTQLGLLEPAGA
jgi:steroid delta-isomerase-like uncharacterized protein